VASFIEKLQLPFLDKTQLAAAEHATDFDPPIEAKEKGAHTKWKDGRALCFSSVKSSTPNRWPRSQ
jgi:hypothetical protein